MGGRLAVARLVVAGQEPVCSGQWTPRERMAIVQDWRSSGMDGQQFVDRYYDGSCRNLSWSELRQWSGDPSARLDAAAPHQLRLPKECRAFLSVPIEVDLQEAAEDGNVPQLCAALSRTVASSSIPGGDVMLAAVLGGHLPAVRLLLEAGLPTVAWDIRGRSLLVLAVLGGDPEVVRLLCDAGYEVDEPAGDGGTALGVAVHEGLVDVAAVLVEFGADPAHCASRGESPLSAAASHGEKRMIGLLAEVAVVSNASACIPPLVAALGTPAQHTRRLLQGGADAAAVVHAGQAAFPGSSPADLGCLLAAVEAGLGVVEAELWQQGALRAEGVGAVKECQISASTVRDLVWYVRSSCPSPEVVRLLVQAGGVNHRGVHGRTPLMLYSVAAPTAAVAQLLASGALVNPRDEAGRTALILAAMAQRVDVLPLLIGAGALLNIRDRDGRTALLYAALARRIDLLRVLVEAGANPLVEDNHGDTVFTVAPPGSAAGVFLNDLHR
mmetsp:Transcript_21372/g.54615  ORF Transcript_21372/g.54615 Transcript_21372/m.54615 type:complete len:497 (+) Transcript_21372:99-1589(+)